MGPILPSSARGYALICAKVDTVNDGPARPSSTDGQGSAEPSDGSSPVQTEFEQLSLQATVVGPGMRTEDHFEPGAKLKIKGERGVFIYKHASLSSSGQVSLHLSGPNGSRAVRPDQVTPVRRRARR